MDTYCKTFQIFCTPLFHLHYSTSKGSLTMPEHQQMQQSRKPDPTFQKQATPASPSHESNTASIIQRARTNPKSMTSADVLQLQRSIGNRAVGRLLSGVGKASTAQKAPVQRQESPEEKEEVQMKTILQRQEKEEKEPLQGKFASGLTGTLQAKEEAPSNKTGMPDHLKSGLENLSGMDISGVRVHYNSSKPAQLNALAYTQGQEIHVAPGQERHLPHEAWHVVQQVQGRVKPTMQLKNGVPMNDDEGLEHEADVMGERAAQVNSGLQEAREDAEAELAEPSTTDRQKLMIGTYMHLGTGAERLPAEAAGHTFVAVEGPRGQREAYGFSPTNLQRYDFQEDTKKLQSGVPGRVHSDNDAFAKPGVRTRSYDVSQEQARAALSQVATYTANPPTFSLAHQDCSWFATDVLKAAKIDDFTGSALKQPAEMYQQVQAPMSSGDQARMKCITACNRPRTAPVILAASFGVAQCMSFMSSYLGQSVTPDYNSQMMLEWWIHKLAVQTDEYGQLAQNILAFAHTLFQEKQNTGVLSVGSLGQVRNMIESLANWSFSVNGILEEAWQRSITRTRSGRTYAKVGSKFADNYAAVLRELAQASPAHVDQINAIETSYVNKHHLMLKSLYPALQIAHENLVHAGIGSRARGNSDLHKAMHELTALNRKLDYSKMDPDIAAMISVVVQDFANYPGHRVFQ